MRFPYFITLRDSDEAEARIRNERPRVLAVSLGATLTGGGVFFRVFLSETGFPNDEWPFVVAFIGDSWTEVELIGYAYALEQATRARRAPALQEK